MFSHGCPVELLMRSTRASNDMGFRWLSLGAEVSFDRRKPCNSLELTTPRSSSEFRQDPVFPRGCIGGADEPCSQQVPQCRPKDCRRAALRRAAPGTGFCAVNLVQEYVRHRTQFVISHNKAVVHGLSRRGQAIDSARPQRGTRLAHAGVQGCIHTPRERSAGRRVGGRALRAWHPRLGHCGLLYLAHQEGHGCSAGVCGDCRPQHSLPPRPRRDGECLRLGQEVSEHPLADSIHRSQVVQDEGFFEPKHPISWLDDRGDLKELLSVDLYIKWIKQQSVNRIPGSSEYAAKTQIRCAIATRPVIALVKRELHLDASLSTPLQILLASVFETAPFRRDLQPDRIETWHEAFC